MDTEMNALLKNKTWFLMPYHLPWIWLAANGFSS